MWSGNEISHARSHTHSTSYLPTVYNPHKSSVDVSKLLNYQPEDGQKWPKQVVDLYVINYTYLYHHIVVLDKYTHSNLAITGNLFFGGGGGGGGRNL